MVDVMKVYEDNASDRTIAAEVASFGVLTEACVFVDMPNIPITAVTTPMHTYTADEMYPMEASYSFPITDPRAIPIPEGATHFGIYFKHFLSGGDSSIGRNEAMWDLRMLVMGLVPDGTTLRPVVVVSPQANTIKSPRTLDNPNNYALVYFEYFQDLAGYQHVLSNMVKNVIPPGVSHLYALFRYSDAATYTPLTGPLTFHIKFW